MDEIAAGKKLFIWFVLVVGVISAVAWALSRSVQVAENAVLHYEEFQEMNNTANKLNTDLCVMRALPEDDKMFEQFSKNQRIVGLQANLNRWVEEYNAKSKMWNRELWKSNTLPYQLSVQQFECYN